MLELDVRPDRAPARETHPDSDLLPTMLPRRRYTATVVRRPRKEFTPPVPRAALGALAVVMTALTMGALVLLPIALDSVAHTLL